MAAFICKVCGAALQLSAGDKICRCGACGVTQTVPLIDDEEKAEICRSAERYRREYRYDKAIALYEELIRAYPTDADLYWSMLLCRYGVEFTAGADGQAAVAMNRTQARSLLADGDYRTALRYADREQRSVMEKQAAEIDRIRRRMVELSRGGERYDIYLSCRERDERGLTTPEHTAAKSLYTRLTNDGFKVFCPDISLEDVQGSEWEPYIYAALNNARVMIVMGFSEESFADVWVSNACSRFAALAAEDSRRVMIPMYRGMPADKLPDVLKPYQAVDMTRLGYENDLVASLSSLLGVSALRKPPAAETAPKDDPLLRRAYLHLEDSEFTEAAAAANRMLEEDPENGEAHLILLMAEYKTASLDTVRQDFSVSENYRNAMRYGSEGLRFRLREYLNAALYGRYTELMQRGSCREAAEGFRMLGDYKDSAALAAQADSLAAESASAAEEQRLQQIYAACVAKLQSSNNIPELQNLQLTLAQMGDYRDCREMANTCASKIAMLTAKQRAVDSGYYSSSGQRAKKVTVLVIAASVFILVGALVALVGISNSSLGVQESTLTPPAQIVESQDTDAFSYAKINGELMVIENLINNGEPSEALQRCLKLQEAELDEQQEQRVAFLSGRAMLEMGSYDDARLVFETLGDYNNSDQWALECYYRQAVELIQQGDTEAAEDILMELDGYSDSDNMLKELRYQQAEALYESGDYAMARAIFSGLGNYSDSRERHCSITCNMAKLKIDEGNYTEALELLDTACVCDEVLNIEPHCHAGLVTQYINAGDYERAEDSLWALRNAVGFEWVRGDGYITLIEHYIENGPDYTAERLAENLAEIDGYEEEAAHFACILARSDMDDRGDYYGAISVLEPHEGVPEADEMLKEARAHINGESYIPSYIPDDVMAFGAEMVDNYSVGQVFVFGNFEQNGNTADGTEPIEWVVIHNEDGYLSAMSLRVLTVQPFGAWDSWEDSWLRNYLNMDFYFRAFSEKERSYLSSRKLPALSASDPINADSVIVPTTSLFFDMSKYIMASDYTAYALAENSRYGGTTQEYWCVTSSGDCSPCLTKGGATIDYIGIAMNVSERAEEYHGVRPVITFRKY